MTKKTLVSIFLTLLLISTFYLSNTFAQYQDYMQFNLPEGAKARLGKGWISGGIAYSPDGTRLAVSSSIGIWIYDAKTFVEVALLTGHTGHVNSVAFSPDGQTLISGAIDSTVRMWNVHTSQLLHTLDEHTQSVNSVAFSPDGKILASGGSDYRVRLWDANTGQLLRTLRMYSTDPLSAYGSASRVVYSVAFSADGKTLATGTRDNRIRLWEVSTGKRLASIAGHEWGVSSVAFSSDGVTLASGAGDGKVQLWGARTGKHWQTVGKHSGSCSSVVFSPDGKILASSGSDKKILLWDAFTGEHLRTLKEHTDRILGLSFSPNGRTLVSASWTEIRFWNTNTGKQKHILEGHTRTVNSVVVSPDGRTLASGHEGPAIMLWDPHSGQHKHTFIPDSDRRYISDTGETVESVAFSSDGRKLAFGQKINGGNAGKLTLWDTHTLEPLHSFSQGRTVQCIAFSPDGSMIANGARRSSSARILLRNARTGEHLRTLDGSRMVYVYSVAFSPDGTTLAMGGTNKWTIQLWDVSTGRRLQVLLDDGDIYSIAFSPDGSTLVSGGADHIIRLWNPRSGELLRTFKGHKDPVLSIVYSPDGNTLVSTCWRNIVFWDIHTGERTRVIVAHTGWINSIAFSPDGNTLASGSYDGTILLWDLTPSDTRNTTPSTPTTSNVKVSLSPSTVQSPATGKQLTLSLNIVDGENVAGYQATVRFDTTALRYVKSNNGDYLPSNAFFIPPVIDGNTVTLAATTLAGESDGEGTLATLTFEVVDAKASTLTLSEVVLTDKAGVKSRPKVESAEITEPTHLPADVNKDGAVNVLDLVLIASNFGKTGINAADVNKDGIVDVVDLVLVAGTLGNAPAAPTVWSRDSEIAPTRNQVKQWLRQAQQVNLTDPAFQRGILVLKQLLAAMTPKETILLPNYPNPFNPETWIPYQLAQSADVSISIYTAGGKLVRRLDFGHQSVGIYDSRSRAAYWDGKNALGEPVASGVYFYTLTAGDFTATRKMLIMK